MLEFTLVGIPLMFIWISTVEMARGMWQYESLQYAAKLTAAYAAEHGVDCATAPNSCTLNMSDVVNTFSTYAAAVPMGSVTLQLTSSSGTVTCSPVSTCSSNSSWSKQWPPTGANGVGADIYIRADYTFKTAMRMFIPGSGTVAFGSSAGAGTFDLPAYAHQQILF